MPSFDVKPGSRWRHHSGRVYTVLFLTNTEGDGVRYPYTVVYEGENGNRWSGPLDDWHRRMTLLDAR
jgi:hypothetical protein